MAYVGHLTVLAPRVAKAWVLTAHYQTKWGPQMTEQNVSTDLVDRLRDAVADVRIPADQAFGIAPQLAELVARAGFQATTGTIAFAGRHATGDFAVQYNNQNGGFSSVWPQWAFELAKDALLGGRKVWVASNGDPFGSNLVFVMILG